MNSTMCMAHTTFTDMNMAVCICAYDRVVYHFILKSAYRNTCIHTHI